MPVNVVDPNGVVAQVDEAQLPGLIAQGYRLEAADARAARVNEQARADTTNIAQAGAAALDRGASLGLTDVAARAIGGPDAAARLQQYKDAHPIVSGVSEGVGMLIDPLGAVGKVGATGTRVAEGLGGGIAARAAGGVVEGGIYGAGAGVSDLALSQDPLTFEHAASVLSSNMLYGGLAGGAVGAAGGALEKGLVRAKGAIDEAVGARSALGALPEDLAGADAKALRGAEKTELDAIEAGRVPQRATLAEDITAHRAATADEKLFLASKGGAADAAGNQVDGITAMAARARKADMALRGLTDNPIAFAEKPQRALEALQRQQAAYEGILAKEPALRAAFAADETGARAAALDAMPTALERNRALQGRIRELAGEPMSQRLAAIRDAKDALASGAGAESAAEKMLGGAAYSATAGAMHALPVPGSSLAAAFIGAKASDLAKKLVFGKLGQVSAEQGARLSGAVESLLGLGSKVGRPAAIAAPVLATKTLASVAYAPTPRGERVAPHPPADPEAPSKRHDLAELYTARSAEIRSQTMYGPDGAAVMRPEARAAVAERLKPFAVSSPVTADRLETIAANKIAFLASKLPRRPDLGGLRMGPDTWRPSDLEMRTFARYAAAVEDPHAVLERVAAGKVTPEDAEAVKAVYPELHAAFTREVLSRLPELSKPVPYSKRIALSIFTGQPLDPAMSPRILSVLQSHFSGEPGTDGGMAPPKAQPAFGSLKKSVGEPTPAQRGRGA